MNKKIKGVVYQLPWEVNRLFFGVKQLYSNIIEQIQLKCYLYINKELFESMRNTVIMNSLTSSYPLPVLMRVFYKALIIK